MFKLVQVCCFHINILFCYDVLKIAIVRFSKAPPNNYHNIKSYAVYDYVCTACVTRNKKLCFSLS